MSDEHDENEDTAAPSDKVKEAMGRRQVVKGKGASTFAVIEGGKGDERPEPPPHDEAPEDGEPDASFDHGDDEDSSPDGMTPEEREIARLCCELDQNDRDNGRRLVYWFGDYMGYVPGMGWICYTGTHWQRDDGELGVRLMAQDLVDKIKLEALCILATPRVGRLIAAAEAAAAKGEEKITPADRALIAKAQKARDQLAKKRSARRNFAITSGNAGKTAAMLSQAASHKKVDQNLLDKDRMQFNCLNGTLTFSRIPDPEQDDTPGEGEEAIVPRHTGHVEFKAHDRTDMITKRAEVKYNPDAKCPRWLKFLEDTHPDSKMRLFLQVFHAYAMLMGGNDEQSLIYHFGTGGNGKSVFIETLGGLAGTFRTVVSPDTVTGDAQKNGAAASSDIAKLFNTRFVVIEELPRGMPLRENLIKAVSGGGTVTARFLQKEFFDFVPMFVAILSGNDLPEISGSDNGIWRRVFIVPWEQTFTGENRVSYGTMMQAFEEERSGILNWLIDGLIGYLTYGMEPFVPERVKEFTQAHREERDPVGRFVAACVLREDGPKVQAKDMFDAYSSWCEANSVAPWKQTAFGRRMTTLGFKKEEGRLVHYTNVRLGDVPSRFDPQKPPAPFDPADPGWKPSNL